MRAFMLAGVAVLAGSAYKVVQINQEFAVNAWTLPRPDLRAARPIYPYSVVPGGVYSVEELFSAIQKDPVVRKHYAGVIKEAVFRQTLDHDLRAHVSYRVGNQVYWTKKEVNLKAGENVLTDAHTIIRSRCGNLLTTVLPPDRPKPPEVPVEPPELVLETRLPPLISEPPAVPTLVTSKLPPVVSPATPTGSSVSVPPMSPTWPARHDPPKEKPAPVPEPASLLTLGTGLLALGTYIRKKRRQR